MKDIEKPREDLIIFLVLPFHTHSLNKAKHIKKSDHTIIRRIVYKLMNQITSALLSYRMTQNKTQHVNYRSPTICRPCLPRKHRGAPRVYDDTYRKFAVLQIGRYHRIAIIIVEHARLLLCALGGHCWDAIICNRYDSCILISRGSLKVRIRVWNEKVDRLMSLNVFLIRLYLV